MSDGLTVSERVRIAVGFLFLAYCFACAVYQLALWLAARRMDKRSHRNG